MRIYEFARQHGFNSKDILAFLRGKNVDIAGHMAVLTKEHIALLQEFLGAKSELPFNSDEHNIVSKQVSQAPEQEKIIINHTSQHDSVESKNNFFKSTMVLESKPLVLPAMPLSVDEIAQHLGKLPSELIILLLGWGIVPAKNKKLSLEVVQKIAKHYQIELVQANVKTSTVITALDESGVFFDAPRVPVVVIIGHVDHGKTTLLDAIRSSRVALKEKGGITQHIAAYTVKTSHGNIIFIDTPGHEAFVKIRARGLHVADIAVLVVAADDGVMPQTIEAIRQAREAKMVIVVAINKVDKVDASRIDVVKSQLAQQGLIVEDWGGDIICMLISAKNNTGITELLEIIALQAELMELKTSLVAKPQGYVLEAKVEKGRGPVATVLLSQGILRLGDYFIAGSVSGRVIAITDQDNKSFKEIFPYIPVQIAGFDGIAEAGDKFAYASRSETLQFKENSLATRAEGSYRVTNGVKIIVRVDNDSTREAVIDGINGINKKSKKQFDIVRVLIGPVCESDVEAAYIAQADIVVLHAKIDPKAAQLAKNKKIIIHYFDIIYKLTEFLQQWIASASLQAIVVKKKIGTASVLKTFDIKNIGVVAGCIIKDGRFTRDSLVVVLRQGRKVGEGKIQSLQREKRILKEVHAGFECGFIVDGFNEWMIGDQVDCYATHTEMK